MKKYKFKILNISQTHSLQNESPFVSECTKVKFDQESRDMSFILLVLE